MEPTPKELSPIFAKWFSVAAWILVLFIGTYFFNSYLSHQNNPNQRVQSSVGAGGKVEVVLQSNRHGHYVATGSINGHPVELMVDTGASLVAVPMHLAESLGLAKGMQITMVTANGLANGYSTQIDQLRLGEIMMQNVTASLYPAADNTVLIGMSFLKHVEFTQKGATLILRQ